MAKEIIDKVGDFIVFVDNVGVLHHALITHVWSTTFNIVYIHKTESDDLYGNKRIKKTTVPFYEKGMSGFYVK